MNFPEQIFYRSNKIGKLEKQVYLLTKKIKYIICKAKKCLKYMFKEQFIKDETII